MENHRLRTILIAVAFFLVLASVVLFYALDTGEGIRERLEGMLLLLFPAVIDSTMEKKRREKVRSESEAPPAAESGGG